MVSDFLVHLFNSQLKVTTIKNYRSAIAAVHEGFSDGSTISSSPVLTQILRGMFNERPPRQRLVPSWDLGRVLENLAAVPYEPAHRSSLLQLSIKLAFLIAAASARRGCEIQALTIQPGHIRWEPGGVRLVPKASFLTKNQTAVFTPPDIFIPEIASILSSVRSDKLWCPIRSLKWYLERTKPLRGTCDQLFISTTPPHGPASKDTIKRWIVSAIKSANPDWLSDKDIGSQGPIRAHDVRAVSTSWAFFRGISFAEISQAACWKGPSTFTTCYLRDVLQNEGAFGRAVLSASQPRRETQASDPSRHRQDRA